MLAQLGWLLCPEYYKAEIKGRLLFSHLELRVSSKLMPVVRRMQFLVVVGLCPLFLAGCQLGTTLSS